MLFHCPLSYPAADLRMLLACPLARSAIQVTELSHVLHAASGGLRIESEKRKDLLTMTMFSQRSSVVPPRECYLPVRSNLSPLLVDLSL